MKRPICIIDDDEDVRGVMCYALEFEGISSISFESALKAEEFLSKQSVEELPCLIIVDYMMPDMDGMDFINLVLNKYSKTIGSIPLALSTARMTDETQGLPESVILLPKPLDLHDLIGVAKKYYSMQAQTCSSF